MACAKYVIVDGEYVSPNHRKALKALLKPQGMAPISSTKPDSRHFDAQNGMQQPKTSKRPKTVPGLFWVDYQIPSLNRTRYQHWTVSRKHVIEAREAWAKAHGCCGYYAEPHPIVRIFSFRSRLLDSDNMFSGGAKGLRDAIAKSLDMDDADKFIQWEYHQIVGKPYGTLVVIV